MNIEFFSNYEWVLKTKLNKVYFNERESHTKNLIPRKWKKNRDWYLSSLLNKRENLLRLKHA